MRKRRKLREKRKKMKVIDMRSLMHRHSVSEKNVRKGCEELDAHLNFRGD